jgi:hypothetical protein
MERGNSKNKNKNGETLIMFYYYYYYMVYHKTNELADFSLYLILISKDFLYLIW